MPFPDATGWVPSSILNGLQFTAGAPLTNWEEYWRQVEANGGEVPLSLLHNGQFYDFPAGTNPSDVLIAHGDSASGYNAGIAPNSGVFASGDPNEIADFRDAQRDESWRGIGRVAALVGGGAALGSTAWGSTVPGATSGTAAGQLTPITTGASYLPGGIPAVDAASAAVWGAGAGGGSVAGGGIGAFVRGNLPSIISGASSLIGGRMAENAAEDATDAMLQANREALDYQRESRDIALGLLEPERQSANAAMARMLQMQGLPIPASLQQALDESGVTLGDFDITQTPGYQNRLSESMRALETSAFARGGGMAGGFGTRALRYAQDFASNEYERIYNQLGTLAGRSTSNSGAEVALNFGGNAASIASDSGAARASGYVAQSNAWQNALDQISQLPWDQWFPGNRQRGALAYGA